MSDQTTDTFGDKTGLCARGVPVSPGNEIISFVSHEFRAPLGALMGALSIIESGVLGDLPPKMRPMLEMAQRNARRLLALSDDLIDADVIESGCLKLHLSPVDLSDVVRDCVSANRVIADRKGVAVEVAAIDRPVKVRADRKRLEQVLTNLLTNAIKFSEEGGTVDVAVVHEGQGARITVRDRGPGIPADLQPRIFQKFAKSDDGNHAGNGLGLYISKAFVEAQDGQIEFTSQPGDTRFVIVLPLSFTDE
ncbi:MAG: HAMP domain-containing histidine kinase [Paracoccaceae bacterium]|nr:HAMP domain-containing histidine kinase [Paracoccaceae bacterium]